MRSCHRAAVVEGVYCLLREYDTRYSLTRGPLYRMIAFSKANRLLRRNARLRNPTQYPMGYIFHTCRLGTEQCFSSAQIKGIANHGLSCHIKMGLQTKGTANKWDCKRRGL